MAGQQLDEAWVNQRSARSSRHQAPSQSLRRARSIQKDRHRAGRAHRPFKKSISRRALNVKKAGLNVPGIELHQIYGRSVYLAAAGPQRTVMSFVKDLEPPAALFDRCFSMDCVSPHAQALRAFFSDASLQKQCLQLQR